MTGAAHSRLLRKIVLPFGCFVIAGSIALLIVLAAAERRHQHELLHLLAADNAAFLRQTHIPATERFADYLSRVHGFRVQFHPHAQPLPPLDRQTDRAVAPLDDTTLLILTRPTRSWTAILQRPDSWLALSGFWLGAAGLAWLTGRHWLQTERLALLSRLTTGLAHEIQNPVAAIRLHAQLGEATALPLIRAETDRIENLIHQWLYLVRPVPPKTSPVALADLLADVLHQFSAQAEHARVRIIQRTATAPVVAADRARLMQALGNLILNAIQAMPGGGTLTIEYLNGRLRFADAGPGFSPAALARGTQLFFSEREGGMGVGLTVAQEIIRAHGGALTLENQPTGGACVCLTLPPAS